MIREKSIELKKQYTLGLKQYLFNKKNEGVSQKILNKIRPKLLEHHKQVLSDITDSKDDKTIKLDRLDKLHCQYQQYCFKYHYTDSNQYDQDLFTIKLRLSRNKQHLADSISKHNNADIASKGS